MNMEQYDDSSAERIEDRLGAMSSAALEAGAYVLGSNDREHTDKSNKKDFVTVADIKSQNILRQSLERSFPGAVILSEEDSEEDRAQLFEPGFTGFVLDPIDGTFNFKRNMRESAISVGEVVNGELVRAVVLDPYKNELFTAEKGKGAFCNGEPITVNHNYSGLDGASVGTSNSYDKQAQIRNLKRELAIAEAAEDADVWNHLHGSGVLIMTNIACGRFDAYHHNGLKPWDNAAAFLIIREAGGVVETLTGEEAPFTSATVLAGTPGAVRDLREIFSRIDPELLT